ncbi:unnamed protein product [Linum tenue]|uniref:Uncharacterized protein n=1 Tax=Linum tenue TaxID=586396 RepID=A0AAV0H5P9_9ROSI|nr:unnamed protein product [Linum tenue]
MLLKNQVFIVDGDLNDVVLLAKLFDVVPFSHILHLAATSRRPLRDAEPPILRQLQHRWVHQSPGNCEIGQPPTRNRLGVVELRLRAQRQGPILRAPPHRRRKFLGKFYFIFHVCKNEV